MYLIRAWKGNSFVYNIINDYNGFNIVHRVWPNLPEVYRGNEMTYQTIEVAPLTPRIGAIVTGINLADPLG